MPSDSSLYWCQSHSDYIILKHHNQIVKKYISPLSILALVCSLSSCEGTVASSDPTAPFTVSADKSTIEADGKDAATLTVTDANGLVLTDEDHIKDVSFHIVETDAYLTRKTNTFSSIDNGTYTIEGMYKGKPCEAPVKVTVSNRSKYEVFTKKVAIYRLTATWCQYCPSMTTALASIDDYSKDRSVVLAFHSDNYFGLKDGDNYLADHLRIQFGGEGYPYAVYSLSSGSGARTRNDLIGFIKDELYNHPAKSGIKATSVVSGDKVSVSASVKVSVDGKYDLGCALIQNGLNGGSDAMESVYNNVVRNISGNYRYMSDNAFTLKASEEKNGLTFDNIQFDSANQKNCSIVLYTLVKDADAVRIDNVVSFPVGGSVDYVYNK